MHEYVKVRGYLSGGWFSSSIMWAKDHNRAIRLGSRHLYSLSHLADPLIHLLNTLTDDNGIFRGLERWLSA